MDTVATLLSRLQFAFTISFHIIFPSLSIGLAAWLSVLEALRLATGRQVYRSLFEFWLKIFGVVFGLGVVSGIVMAFQFGTNWSARSAMSSLLRWAAWGKVGDQGSAEVSAPPTAIFDQIQHDLPEALEGLRDR